MDRGGRESNSRAVTQHPERIFGLRFSPDDTQALADHLAHIPSPLQGAAEMLFTANLDHIVKMRSNGAFRAAYNRATFVTADGMPVYFYARWRGVPVPERVTGADLFPALMARFEPDKHRPFFVVSDEETALRIEANLSQRGFEDVQVVVPPFGFDADETYSSELARRIAAFRTTHLLFCVGAPKSELWLDRHRDAIGPCYAMALGAGANFFAGTAQRAPRLMRNLGGEWLWRVLCEPRRLFRRYFVDSWAFLLAIADDLRGKTSP